MCATLLVDPAPRDTFVASSVAISGRGESQYTYLAECSDRLLSSGQLATCRRSRQQTAVSLNSTTISILWLFQLECVEQAILHVQRIFYGPYEHSQSIQRPILWLSSSTVTLLSFSGTA